jgi:hypothetical protein
MLKSVTVVVFFLSILLFSGCSQSTDQQTVSQSQQLTTPLPATKQQEKEEISLQQPAQSSGNTTENPTSPQENSNATTNWKTYRNTKYRYSFKYPDSVELDKDSKTDSRDVAITSKDNAVSLVINVHSGGGTFIDDNTGKCHKEMLVKTISVDNQNIEICQSRDNDNNHNFYTLYTLISKETKGTDDDIYAEIIGTSDRKQQTQEFFEKFVSSFVFLK